jgi:hypothetical protein
MRPPAPLVTVAIALRPRLIAFRPRLLRGARRLLLLRLLRAVLLLWALLLLRTLLLALSGARLLLWRSLLLPALSERSGRSATGLRVEGRTDITPRLRTNGSLFDDLLSAFSLQPFFPIRAGRQLLHDRLRRRLRSAPSREPSRRRIHLSRR